MADGAELLLIGAVTRALSAEWHLSASQRASVVSIIFVGIVMGNALSGPLGDQFGRRQTILLSYAGVCVFSVLSACATSFATLRLVQVLVGASFGIAQPTFGALCSETTPAYWRIATTAASQALFIVGELYSCVLIWLDDPTMQDLDWRRLLLLGAIPSGVMGIIAIFFLMQSPSYLALRGDHDGAKSVLAEMSRQNGVALESVDFKPLPQSTRSTLEAYIRPIRLVYSPHMLYSTFAVCYSSFTLNCIFYGCLYAFPQLVTTVDMGTMPVVTLMIGALWEFPGFLLGLVLGMIWPRKRAMMAYLGMTATSLIAFSLGVGGMSSVLLHGGYAGIKGFACIGYIVVFQYATEIYPTEARATGTAACLAGGRFGGILAPVLCEKLLQVTGHFVAFFNVIAGLCILNFLIVVLLPMETFGMKLADVADERRPLVP